MSQTVAEFVYFQVKPSVKPEDPSSDEGAALLQVFNNTKAQSGYKSSAWGRTVEDENTIVWVVEWSDAHTGTQSTQLTPFLSSSSSSTTTPTNPTIFFTTLTPPLSASNTLTTNPVTELCALAFPHNISPQAHEKLSRDLVGFRSALMERLPSAQRAMSWTMGYVERPGAVPMEKSPSGAVTVHILAVGWESVDKHMAAKATEQFGEGIGPIREVMCGVAPGAGMKHVAFKKI